eukprot:364339-Chlamydomonas_euryale.AAC.7
MANAEPGGSSLDPKGARDLCCVNPEMQGCAAECTILLPYPPPYTPPIVCIPYRTVPPSSTYWPYRNPASLHARSNSVKQLFCQVKV